MILQKRTVFVLGAGASAPYGFPIGSALADLIVQCFASPDHPTRGAILQAGADEKLMTEFARVYPWAACPSVDAYLESNPDYNHVVKLAIAALLIPKENDPALIADGGDWMDYLFARILPATPQDLRLNQLSVITFNFDRSFERRLFLAIRHRYSVDDAEAARLSQHIAVVHVHGSLGLPAWIHPPGGTAFRREYSGVFGADELRGAAESIRIIHEQVDEEGIASARRMLQWAERVCFLGFGYHPMNLERLQVERLVFPRWQLMGTGYKFRAGDHGAVIRRMPDKFDLKHNGVTVLDLLQDTDIIHD
jgi:hypothetical protein